MKIVITGASRGIGYQTALQLAGGMGHEVLVLSRREELLQALKKTAQEQRVDCRLEFMRFDLSDPDFNGLRAMLDEMGGVDILINNAGLLINKPFMDLQMSDWRRSFEVNFFGVVELTHFLLPWLKESATAHIVNISSMGAFQGSAKFPGLLAYSAAKAALANFTECLAEELKEEKVAVNCLALGAVNTEMLQEAFPGYEAPLGSMEMGHFIADFALEKQRFFNGKILPVSVSTP